MSQLLNATAKTDCIFEISIRKLILNIYIIKIENTSYAKINHLNLILFLSGKIYKKKLILK